MSAIAPALGQRRMMMLIVLVGAAFVLFFPAKQLVQQRQRIGSLEDRLVQLRAENDVLSEDVARLSKPDELEVLARERLGLVKPGERAYFVEPIEPEPTASPEQAPRASWWERTWESFTSLLRGGD
jgi:cell division protein FtsB